MINLSKKPSRSQSGFSLFEVLISMIVIGIGLLGLGGLQIVSLKGSGNAHSRIMANMLAMELSDRMRANPIGSQALFYADTVSCGATGGGTNCRINNSCTPQEVANFDVQEVMCGVSGTNGREGGIKNLLSNSALLVTAQPANCTMSNRVYTNSQYKIDITWSDRNVHKDQQASAQDQQLTLCIAP